MNQKKPVIAVCMSAAMCLSLNAQAELLEPIVVEDKAFKKGISETGRSLQEHPGAATVISEEEIDQLKPLSTIDVLKTVPGIFAPSEYGRGLRPNIGFRGLSPNRSRSGTLLLADGVPIQPAVYGDKSAYYNVPVENVSSIEVIRGGASVLYGPGNIGGTVNFITHQPPAERTFRLRETIRQGGLFSTYLSAGDSDDDGTGYLLSYANKFGETVRENTDTNTHDFTVKVSSPTIGGGNTWYRFNYYREHSNTPGGLSVAQFEADPTQSVRSNDIFKGRRASADFHFDIPLVNNFDFESLAYLSFFERDWQIANAVDSEATANRHFEREFVVFGVEPRVRASDILGGDWTVGARVHFENMNDVRRIGATPTALTGPTDRESTLITSAFSPYIEAEYNWDQLTVIAGLRQEIIEQKINVGLRGDPVGAEDRADTTETVGGIGLTYALGDIGNIYTGLYRTFEPPRFSEAVDPTTGTDRDLDSETGTNFEIGFRGQLLENLAVDAGIFSIDFDNQIVSEAGVQVNAGETSHQGFEGSLVFEATPKLSFDINYTFVDTEAKTGANKGNRLPSAPENILSWGATFQPSEKLSLRVDGNYVDERFSNGANTVEESADGNVGLLPDYNVVNVRADFEAAGMMFFLGVNNVLDEAYRERRQGFFNGIIPGQAMSAYAGVEVKL